MAQPEFREEGIERGEAAADVGQGKLGEPLIRCGGVSSEIQRRERGT